MKHTVQKYGLIYSALHLPVLKEFYYLLNKLDECLGPLRMHDSFSVSVNGTKKKKKSVHFYLNKAVKR